jgi:regulator of protease activity HflC (stomatin/prohibitin superfamily)
MNPETAVTEVKPPDAGRRGDRLTNIFLVFLFLLLILLYFYPDMVVSVYPGEAGVVWDRFLGGTRVDVVYGEGIHFVAPWNRFYKYDVRIRQYTKDYEALTRNGLPIRVTASVRFRPDGAPFEHAVNRGPAGENSLGKLHQRIGPDYRDKVVVPVVASVIRQVIGRYNPEDVYHLQPDAIQDEIVAAIASRRNKATFADEQEIEIIDVLIEKTTLPEGVRAAIEKKMAEEQAMLAYDFTVRKEQKEAERKAVEAQGIRRFQDVIGKGIDPGYIRLKSIEALLEIAKSSNSKIVVLGGKDGVPFVIDPSQEPPLKAPAAKP